MGFGNGLGELWFSTGWSRTLSSVIFKGVVDMNIVDVLVCVWSVMFVGVSEAASKGLDLSFHLFNLEI